MGEAWKMPQKVITLPEMHKAAMKPSAFTVSSRLANRELSIDYNSLLLCYVIQY
jgi:hypothetical protein